MRLFCATFFLAFCLLSAVINDASALTYHPDQASISAPNLLDSNTLIEKRVLRSNDADKADSKDDVERAYIPGLSSLAGTLSKISPSAQNVANKMWLKSRTDPALVFNTLRLGKTGVKLDDNPRFILWLKYVDMYSGLRSHSFSDDQVFQLLQKSNSDEKLVALFQSLRKVPSRKALAEQMQISLFERSASSRELLNAAWLKSRETPENVYKMLHLENAALNVGRLKENSKFLQWFKYTQMYGSTVTHDPSNFRTFNFLQKKLHVGQSDFELVPLFQSLKQTSGLDDLGDNLQSFLFMTWVDKQYTPKFVQSQLALPFGTGIFELPKEAVLYRALEEYTVYFTARRGGKEVLKTVQGLFANNKPDEALAAAMKLHQ